MLNSQICTKIKIKLLVMVNTAFESTLVPEENKRRNLDEYYTKKY